jgi:glycerol-3-phosphate dehydrogenase
VVPGSAETPFEFSFRTRQAHWQRLKDHPTESIDLAIIGGGIVGAGVLRELSRRGRPNTFLFEKNDFASATSGASSKLIHAGLRYLEQVWIHLKAGRLSSALTNLRFVFEASLERKRLGRLAPILIVPKPIHFVLGKEDPRTFVSVCAGVLSYYFMQVLQGQRFSFPTMTQDIERIANQFPEMDAKKVKAVFRFWDSETDDARLVIETLQSAHQHGGAALNYVELRGFEQKPDGVWLRLYNKELAEEMLCRANHVINATGPFVDEVRAREFGVASQPAMVDRVAGSHIDVVPAISEHSFYVSAHDNRLVFLLRRNEDGLAYTRIGTTERPLKAGESSDGVMPSVQELDYLRQLVAEYFPNARLNEVTEIRRDAGIRPLQAQEGSHAFHKSREHAIVRAGRITHVIGAKLTDFRRVSSEVADAFVTSVPEKGSMRTRAAARMYLETTVEEVVERTMPVHFTDYVFRRRGLRPILNLKNDRAELNTPTRRDFEAFAAAMKWGEERRAAELKLLINEESRARGK